MNNESIRKMFDNQRFIIAFLLISTISTIANAASIDHHRRHDQYRHRIDSIFNRNVRPLMIVFDDGMNSLRNNRQSDVPNKQQETKRIGGDACGCNMGCFYGSFGECMACCAQGL